jgi:flavin-dependent dehydrogenase
LNPGALAVLRRLGLHDSVERRGVKLNGMIVTGTWGISVRGDYVHGGTAAEEYCGRAITRRELDQLLVTAAAEAGARIDEGVVIRGPLVRDDRLGARVRGVIVTGRDGRPVAIRAGITIAADGRTSRVASALGLITPPRHPRRWVVSGYFDGVHGLSAYGEMHIRGAHYLGVAPVPDGIANVCYVSRPNQQFADPARLLTGTVGSDPLLRDRFQGARLLAMPVSMGPLAVDARAAGTRGLLLAGDAAGFIDPMTGDGLRFALRGAELAAQAALEMLATSVEEGHVRLAARRAREFGAKWRVGRVLRAWVGQPVGVALGSIAAAVAPALLRHVIGYAGDVDQVRPAAENQETGDRRQETGKELAS